MLLRVRKVKINLSTKYLVLFNVHYFRNETFIPKFRFR